MNMNKIGQKIRDLRRKNDLTQEKLADFLGVTYQSVSKWECGVTAPDLALIGPLTKLLHVTSDELLGLTDETNDERRAVLEENLRQAWINGGELDDFAQVYAAEEALVREYPGNMKILCDFAWTASNRAMCHKDPQTEMEKAIRYFQTVIENTENTNLKADAVRGITQSLGFLERYDEAKQYAELLPDAPGFTKDDVLEHCLRGEALREHRQKRLETALHRLVVLTGQCARDKLQSIRLCEKILRLFFPDGNCLEFHCNLAELAYEKAVLYLREQRYDDAVCALKEYKEHAVLADKADVHAEELRYTSPYFDLLTLPPYLPDESYTPSYHETFVLQMQDKTFDPLRDRADFRAILD